MTEIEQLKQDLELARAARDRLGREMDVLHTCIEGSTADEMRANINELRAIRSKYERAIAMPVVPKSSKVILAETLAGLLVAFQQENGRLQNRLIEHHVENVMLRNALASNEETIRALGTANAELRAEVNAARANKED